MLHLHRNCFFNIRYALNSITFFRNAPIFCLNVLGIYGRGKLKPYGCMYVCMYVCLQTCMVVRSYSDHGAIPIKIKSAVRAQILCSIESPFSGQ
jgi:hypothetical protein